MVLDEAVFKHIVIGNSIERRQIQIAFLNNVELFNDLDKFQKSRLIDGFEVLPAKKGEYIFREGDIGDNFYIIEEGEVECLKYFKDMDGVEHQVNVRNLYSK